MSYTLPQISAFGKLTNEEQVEVLNHLFEPCPTLTSLLLPLLKKESFDSYRSLIEKLRQILLDYLQDKNSKIEVINKVISAHPRLGPSKEKLSSHSTSEQKSLSSSSPQELAKLVKLNELYEIYFPGLRFVVFVNGRSREAIMENMLERIKRNDIELEKKEAFNAMCDIALDRATKLGAKL